MATVLQGKKLRMQIKRGSFWDRLLLSTIHPSYFARLVMAGIIFMESASKIIPPRPPSPSPSAASRTVRTGVLIHGYHLGAKGWRSIMWGDEDQQILGRLPHGARLAWQEDAVLVVIGTGASEKDGVLEGRFALEYLTKKWEELGKFHEAFRGIDLEEMRRAVEPALVAEVRSKNTRQELTEAGRLFRKERCDRIILVSSPTHLPRCLRDASSLWLKPPSLNPNASCPAGRNDAGLGERPMAGGGIESDCGNVDGRLGNQWHPVVLASPSDTSFADFGPEDVAIVEPPHRPDTNGRDAHNTSTLSATQGLVEPSPDPSAGLQAEGYQGTRPLLHELVASALRVRREDQRRFLGEFQALLQQYVPEE